MRVCIAAQWMLLAEAVLCAAGRWAASLTSDLYMLVAPPLPS